MFVFRSFSPLQLHQLHIGLDLARQIRLNGRDSLIDGVFNGLGLACAVGLDDRLPEPQEGRAAHGVRVQPLLELVQTILPILEIRDKEYIDQSIEIRV